jgi:bacillolysin
MMSFKLVVSFLICLGAFNSAYTINLPPAATSVKSLKKQSLAAISDDTLIIQYGAESKQPIFVSSKINDVSPLAKTLTGPDIAVQRRASCKTFLSSIRHALKISQPADELTVEDAPDNGSSENAHFKIRQRFHGITVLGAEATVHLHGGRADFVGRTIATPDISTVPGITRDMAIERALSDLRGKSVSIINLSAEDRSLLEYDGPSADLVIFPSTGADNSARLAYQVLVRPDVIDWWEYVIDAETGGILLKYNRTCDAGDATANVKDLKGVQRLIHTYQSDKYYLIDASRPMFIASQSQIPNKLSGAIVTYDYLNKYPATSSYNLITSTNNTWDAKAVSAHYNASVAYEYYRTTHNRNSINGKGGSILSFINVADQNGAALDNAYWNGKGMYYGNGNKVFTPLAAALDVAGHELTHGVVEATAALRYVGQSGALNESFADIFGCMIERQNWTMGESIVKPGLYPSNALRDLANPHNGTTKGRSGWQPQNMSEYQVLANTSAGDNGGVHINDGIPNRAYYLFATAVTKEKAERVYYRTITTYLSASSQFADLRIGARLACQELYGKDSPEDSALARAFDTVGILENTQPFDHVDDLPVNSGREYVLLTAAPPASDGTTLYIADSAFGSLKSISKRPVKFRPSVSDDGKKVLFVSGDKKLIALTLNGTVATETVVDTAKIWSLCAISRDGKRYAAVKDKKDTAIYIGGIDGGPLHKYNLTGPADSNGGAVTGAVYSSALEWNPAGDDVIYDVYNSLSGQGGYALTNWDIGFLRSWDPGLGTYGDGEVNKLFNNLGDGISVGNPTFSKNSPNVIAYESIDNTTTGVSEVIMNMETRKTSTIATSAFPGYSSFSKRDDKIAFSTINGTDTVISILKLKTDKQTPDGTPAIGVRKMKWAVFFAQGTRALPTGTIAAPREFKTSKLELMVLSCKNGFKGLIAGAGNSPIHVSIARADGRAVYRETILPGGKLVPYAWNATTSGGNRIGRGVYFVRIETTSSSVAKKLYVLE